MAAWPAVALVGSCELLVMNIRSSQARADVASVPGVPADPLQVQAAQTFADDLAANHVPSVRAIRVRLHVGQPRAQRVQAYLAAITSNKADPGRFSKTTVLQPYPPA